MRRLTLWAGVALLTFALLVAFAVSYLRGRGGAERSEAAASAPVSLPSTSEPLELCRLLASPQEYEGQTLTVRATYFASVHGARLYDAGCVDKEIDVSAVASPGALDEIAQGLKDAYGASDAPAPLELVAVGRFDDNHPSHVGRTVADNAPYRFELTHVEKAARAPSERRRGD